MGLDLAQPKAQPIWAGPGRPKSAQGRKILAQTHPYTYAKFFSETYVCIVSNEQMFPVQKVEKGSSIITHFHNAYMINV